MKEWYYKKLLNKLKRHLFKRDSSRISFTRYEIEDLYYLWKDEAIKKWELVK